MNSKEVDPDDKEAVQQNAKIDKMLRSDKKTLDRTIKILLLGEKSHVLGAFARENNYAAH
jgi:hypothetical protein